MILLTLSYLAIEMVYKWFLCDIDSFEYQLCRKEPEMRRGEEEKTPIGTIVQVTLILIINGNI